LLRRLKISPKNLNPHLRIKLSIDSNQCKGCGICVVMCPWEVLARVDELSEKGYPRVTVVEAERCIACGRCSALCPDFAISVEVESMRETC
jgi:2-oxoglutarate ferredoxin oxidoreductase subunit delta